MALGPKWGKNGPKMSKKSDLGSFFYFFLPFLGHFFPISGRGPFSFFLFFANCSHFWNSARFPFYTRRPDSQNMNGNPLCSRRSWGRKIHPEGDAKDITLLAGNLYVVMICWGVLVMDGTCSSISLHLCTVWKSHFQHAPD